MKKDKPSRFNLPLKNSSDQPVPGYVTYGGELSLSSSGQLELLRGMEERGVPLRFMVSGYSMRPFIRDQDVLTVAPLGNREPHRGDVVAFTRPEIGKLVIHRVIAKRGSGWLLRGDNCLEADGVVVLENILGRVVRTERGGREVRLGLKAGAGKKLIALLSGHNLLLPLIKLLSVPFRLVRMKGKT